MGQNFSTEPVVEKETWRNHNDAFNAAVSSCQGWRMSQEDNHSLIIKMPGEHDASFFAVYDGHGSARVSHHASGALSRHIIENEMYSKGNFKEALEQAFLTFDKEVRENREYNAQLAGTTAVCVLIVNNKIYCANIGDSRAVASVNCECIPLSYDHKPENPQELERIVLAGGYVLGNRVNGNLALSRAFGDFHYKGNKTLPPEQQIVSPCPDIKILDLNDDVDFLVLACDGIWDVLSSEEVVEFVISRLEEVMDPGLICEQLTTRCLATDYELVIGCDNMTVLLVCYTRGRSWEDYCTDIFNKNTQRLGKPRTRPTSEEEKSSSLASTTTPTTAAETITAENISETKADVEAKADADEKADAEEKTGIDAEAKAGAVMPETDVATETLTEISLETKTGPEAGSVPERSATPEMQTVSETAQETETVMQAVSSETSATTTITAEAETVSISETTTEAPDDPTTAEPTT